MALVSGWMKRVEATYRGTESVRGGRRPRLVDLERRMQAGEALEKWSRRRLSIHELEEAAPRPGMGEGGAPGMWGSKEGDGAAADCGGKPLRQG